MKIRIREIRSLVREMLGGDSDRLASAGKRVFWGFKRHEGQPEELAQQIAAEEGLSVDDILDAFEDEYAKVMAQL